MSKYTWMIELNKYDPIGIDHLVIKADSCVAVDGMVSFFRNEKNQEDSIWDNNYMVAMLPSDRVMSVELLDNETGEPIGFIPND